MENVDVARLFQQVADLLELRGDNPFRVRAYRNAARTIETMPRRVAEIIAHDGKSRSADRPGGRAGARPRSGSCRARGSARNRDSALLGLAEGALDAQHFDPAWADELFE